MFSSLDATQCRKAVFQQHIGPKYGKFARHIKLCYEDDPQDILPFLTGSHRLTSLDLDNTALIDHFPQGWLVDGSSEPSTFSPDFSSFFAGFIEAAKSVRAVKFAVPLPSHFYPAPRPAGILRPKNRARVLRAVKSIPHLVALGITSKLWGSRLSYEEHWRLVESVADRLEVLELEYEDFDHLKTSSSPITFPKLRQVIIHCTHGIHAVLDQLKGSPVIEVTCDLSGLDTLERLLDAFPTLKRLNITQSGHPDWDVLGLYDIASTFRERGVALQIRCSTFPSLQISDLLLDRPDTREAAKEALKFAATKRTVAFRTLRRRRFELNDGPGVFLGQEKLTIKSLEELRLAWMD
ncbi:hypothetical protein P7C70_g4753, partial [Phenoliferia sp. Uapishka_3]